jgi:plastocyanin
MRWMTLLCAVAVLALAGCGGSDNKSSSSSSSGSSSSSSSGGGGETIKISADPNALKFDKSTLSAKAGKVTIQMANPAGIPHAVSIEGNGVDSDGNTVNKGGTSTVSADLKPGKYTFYCPVDGHEQAGMKGTLTVS